MNALDRARWEVTELAMHDDVPFTEIESRIDAMEEFDAEQRSALWLLAWSHQGTGRQRFLVQQTFAMLSARERAATADLN